MSKTLFSTLVLCGLLCLSQSAFAKNYNGCTKAHDVCKCDGGDMGRCQFNDGGPGTHYSPGDYYCYCGNNEY